jgi:hypothetical protein
MEGGAGTPNGIATGGWPRYRIDRAW